MGTVEYHAQMSALLEVPTIFRLLNDPGRGASGRIQQQFSIAERGPEFIQEDLSIALKTMRTISPSGVTPLADHVREIRSNVVAMEDQLLQSGQKVVIVLATDGLPTNSYGISSSATKQEFQDSIRRLEGLPVWIVIRLCTDEETVVDTTTI